MSSIVVRVTRAAFVDGRHVEPGTTLKLQPLQAHDLVVGAGRGEYVHADDHAVADAAHRAEVLQQLKQQRRLAPDPGSPWQRVN